MRERSAAWFRNVAVGCLVLSLAMVPALELLLHSSLSLWLHIPLTFVTLNLMALGAGASGVAYLEYRARSSHNGKQA
jgi:hypothetical protein